MVESMNGNHRNIDALVAEHVMGWWLAKDEDGEWCFMDGADFVCFNFDVPHYSTDIAAAWEVVEKMGHVGLNWDDTTNSPARWQCIMERGEYYADTAPMAICLAALKAKGVDVE
jgi:hypothetical protein